MLNSITGRCRSLSHNLSKQQVREVPGLKQDLLKIIWRSREPKGKTRFWTNLSAGITIRKFGITGNLKFLFLRISNFILRIKRIMSGDLYCLFNPITSGVRFLLIILPLKLIILILGGAGFFYAL